VSTINSLSARLLFTQKGLSKVSEILHGVLTHKKYKIGGEHKSVVDFLGFLEKSLESPAIFQFF
jgi:hypothetical protein